MPAMMISQPVALNAAVASPAGVACLRHDEQQDGRRDDRDEHAAGRQQVAVAGRGRRVHPDQADDEGDSAGQPGQPDEDFDGRVHATASASSAFGAAAAGLRLNIWSIRSVTT